MSELVILSAADAATLTAEMRRLVEFIDRVSDVSLSDIAYTCSLTRGDSVVAIIAGDVADLRARLVSACDRISSPTTKRIRDKSGTYYFREHLLSPGGGRLAFLYPGVNGFYPDMMRDLTIALPECRTSFDELEEALADDGKFTPSSFVFPPAPYYRHDADIFKSGAYAQALVSTYAGCIALTRLLMKGGVRPDGVVGFAGGDLAAMIRSGAAGEDLPRPERVRLIRDIYDIVHKAVNHGGLPTVAVYTVLLHKTDEIDSLFEGFPPDKVMPAIDFSPRQKTYVVTLDYEAVFVSVLSSAGLHFVKLALDRPFNTPLCSSLVPAIRKFAANWMKHAPACDVYSCATAGRVPLVLKPTREDIAERWAKPVKFAETVRRMYADGYRVFLEVGPRGMMSAAVEDTLHGEEHAAIALNSIHRCGILQAQHAVAQLAALGAKLDLSWIYERRRARRLDFDAAISMEVRKDSEMPLSRAFPRLTLLSPETVSAGSSLAVPKGRGARAASRAAAVAANKRRQRQFDFGAINPLVSDADTLTSSPGVSVELTKTFRIADMPFLGDFALGASQISYSDPNLKGLVLLTLPVAAEIMAEVAQIILPNRSFARIEDLNCRRRVQFVKGALTLFMRAERTPSSNPHEVAVKVQIRDDSPNAAYTWPVMEATVVLTESSDRSMPASVEPLSKPRSVHWSGRDIYSARLSLGSRLRGIQFVEAWGEEGLDYEVEVPPLAGNVLFTRFPAWVLNPILTGIVVSGFPLWRSHERFVGAFSFPFRLRRLDFGGYIPNEGARLKCYLRLTGMTSRSLACDITVTDGNGKVLMTIYGWEELAERVPVEYCELVRQPATTFLTESLSAETLGDPATDIASAFITDVPYPIFERNEELWLKTLSQVILGAGERKEFRDMTGSVSRRTEWLFGRVAAKEAVRRFLKDFYQARWSDADIQIWADDSGKPHALGAWNDFLTTKLDIAIAHTEQFVVALAAANARVGVDVESSARNLSEEFATGVFTPEELELAAQAISASQTLIKFWCAKEAVSKALGTGIRYSPKEMVIMNYNPDAGHIVVRLEGAWVEAFKNFRGRDIGVTVKSMREHALAFCFLPAALLTDEGL